MPALLPWIALCALACALLLLCERRSVRIGSWVFKPIAATAFVGAAIALGAQDSGYGRWVLAGLALCWLGDLLLIPKRSKATFLAGIGSFLLGHVAYAIAFARLGLSGEALAWSIGIVAIPALVALRWLWPHLTGIFATAVPVYVVVIGTMVALSVSAAAAGAPAGIAVGAAMFALSDLSVARDRLVAASFANGAWGLPLYFSAQLVLASTVAAVPG